MNDISNTDTTTAEAVIPDGVVEHDGNKYMRDARGALMPLELVKAEDKLKDEVVRKVMSFAKPLSDQVRRFAGYTFRDVASVQSLLEQEYGVTVGGKKGNIQLMSYDALFKVEVRVRDRLEFGPEILVAKALFDECLLEWSAETRPELRSLIVNAFNADSDQRISRSDVFMLLRTESDDEKWIEAQRALGAALIVVGTKSAIYLWERESVQDGWTSITINMAKA